MKRELCHFNHVTHSHKDRGSIEDVSLDIYEGETLYLLGTRGSGNSIVSRILAMQISDVKGVSWYLAGKNRKKHPNYYYISEKSTLIDNFSIAENLAMAPWAHTKKVFFRRKKVYKRVADLFDRYNIDLKPETKAGSLSKGDRIIVEMMKAIHNGVELLVFDEAFSNLEQEQITRIQSLRARFPDITTIISQYSFSSIAYDADRILYFSSGRLIYSFDARNFINSNLIETIYGNFNNIASATTRTRRDDEYRLTINTGSGNEPVKIEVRSGEILRLAESQNIIDEALNRWIQGSGPGAIAFEAGGRVYTVYHKAVKNGLAVITELSVENAVIKDLSFEDNMALAAELQFSPFAADRNHLRNYVVDNYAIDLHLYSNPVLYFERMKMLIRRWTAANPKLLIIGKILHGLSKEQLDWVIDNLDRMVNAGTALVIITYDEMVHEGDVLIC